MTATNDGASGLALAFAGSMDLPNHTVIGSGSGTASVTNTALIAQTGSQLFTGGSMDIGTPRFVTMISDFGATQMSGTGLTEFGINAGSGTMFGREGFGAITFDSTNELQTEITFEIYASGT